MFPSLSLDESTISGGLLREQHDAIVGQAREESLAAVDLVLRELESAACTRTKTAVQSSNSNSSSNDNNENSDSSSYDRSRSNNDKSVTPQVQQAVAAAAKAITAYSTLVFEHLQEEERQVVHRWLTADEEQYGSYRRSLPIVFRALY